MRKLYQALFIWGLRCRSDPTGHVSAFVSAGKADGSAFLAVVHVVPSAFFAASLADFGTQRANGLHMFAAPGHGRRRKGAGRSAFNVQRDASGHHLDIVLLQAGGCALMTFDGAVTAKLQALEKLFFHAVHSLKCGKADSGLAAGGPGLNKIRLFTVTAFGRPGCRRRPAGGVGLTAGGRRQAAKQDGINRFFVFRR